MSLPRYQEGQGLSEYLDRLVSAIEREIATGAAGGPYRITNLTPLRTLDASVATSGQTAQFAATLAQDLRRKGILA